MVGALVRNAASERRRRVRLGATGGANAIGAASAIGAARATGANERSASASRAKSKTSCVLVRKSRDIGRPTGYRPTGTSDPFAVRSGSDLVKLSWFYQLLLPPLESTTTCRSAPPCTPHLRAPWSTRRGCSFIFSIPCFPPPHSQHLHPPCFVACTSGCMTLLRCLFPLPLDGNHPTKLEECW